MHEWSLLIVNLTFYFRLSDPVLDGRVPCNGTIALSGKTIVFSLCIENKFKWNYMSLFIVKNRYRAF